MESGYISIKQILDDLLAHPLLRDLSLERAVDHAVHFIRIVGMPKATSEKQAVIKIHEYRALLPTDYYGIIQVKEAKNGTVLQSTINGPNIGSNENIKNLYNIQGNIIYTSLKEGELEISYKALLVDEDGYPLLPDNSSFIQALELYIKKRHFTVLFDMGKITPQVLNNVQQEYAWYVGQCQSDLVRPTLDEMKFITNTWNNIIINKKYS